MKPLHGPILILEIYWGCMSSGLWESYGWCWWWSRRRYIDEHLQRRESLSCRNSKSELQWVTLDVAWVDNLGHPKSVESVEHSSVKLLHLYLNPWETPRKSNHESHIVFASNFDLKPIVFGTPYVPFYRRIRIRINLYITYIKSVNPLLTHSYSQPQVERGLPMLPLWMSTRCALLMAMMFPPCPTLIILSYCTGFLVVRI